MNDILQWLTDTRWTMSPVVLFAIASAFHFVVRKFT
tara:strand:+ start:922 stop:1029 length:108 start_codon:yes stop_codon:yes gene_type:complete